MTGLRPVVNDEQLAVLRILVDRRRSLGEDHTRMVSQLHQLLLELEWSPAEWCTTDLSEPVPPM